MKRRRSRLSTFAPTTVDLDYAGNAGALTHIINQNINPGKVPTKADINFALNLRGYKN
jgi:hypothetical protein